MFRIFFLLTIWAVTGFSVIVYAQENRLTFGQLESRSLSIKNPFKPQLPEKDKGPEMTEETGAPPVEPVSPIDIPETVPEFPSPEYIPPEEGEAPMPVLTVTGVIWNSDRPQAIINDQIVNIGDMILGVEITNIQKSGIDVLFNGRTVTIPI